MENRFPKNVRQIGNVSDTPKIYVEDYVDTFLNQLCENTDEMPAGAFLIGHTVRQEDEECIYISGAIRMEEIEVSGTDIVISEVTLSKAQEECREHFSDGEMIGWFLAMPGHPLILNSNLARIHEQYFGRPGTVFVMKEPAEKDELYFAYKYKELMQMSGHYVYYEKNPAMQNYMIRARKKIGATPSEDVADKAAKNFRNIVRERVEVQEQRRSSRFMYVASVFLVLVVLVIGVTTLNNYDKMQAVQLSLEDIKESVVSAGDEEEEEEVDVLETSGAVQAEVEQTAEGDTIEDEDEQQSESVDQDEAGQSQTGEGAAEEEEAVSTIQEMTEDIYVVQKGDTLAKISKKVYGDTGHVDAICRMNGLSDGNLIFIGQKLLLP